MRRIGREPGVLGNPILIGSLTVLVAIVAVTLAYSATTGLPFVPTYGLHVQAADASELQKGDEVSLGGALVGAVSSVTPARTRDGRAVALLNLRLKQSIQPLPVNSRFTVRLKGSIGLKYLQITLGSSRRGLPDGATVALSQSGTQVDFDQVLSMFTPPTRVGVRRATIGFGETLAGRGGNLNDAFHALAPLVADLGPVMANLRSAHTDLGRFFHELERYTGALVPVARTQATLFAHLDTTFAALAGVATPYLQNTIARTPPTFQTTITDGPKIRSFLSDTAVLLHDFRPGAATLTSSAPVLAAAFAAGTRNLPGTGGLDRRTVALARTLQSYSATGAVQGGLDRLTLTAQSLRAPLAFLTPVQTSCNDITLFLRNINDLLSERVSQGGLLRFVQVAIRDQPGFESGPSRRPYTGPGAGSSGPLHVDPYPNTASPGQPAECAAGNEPYLLRAQIGNPPGNVGLGTEATLRARR